MHLLLPNQLYPQKPDMPHCKDCIHYEPCYEYGNILDPIHGGVICDSFKLASDVVEVVRCKDCKYCEHINDEFAKDWYQCKRRGNFAKKKPTDYCSYGERKCDK